MKISPLDRSLYFKGLLLLVRKDDRISAEEFGMMLEIGRHLDFEPGFCKSTIRKILDNKIIEDVPPRFSSQEIATSFIMDGLTVGYCDHELSPSELSWLESIAQANHIQFQAIFDAWKSLPPTNPPTNLEVAKLVYY